MFDESKSYGGGMWLFFFIFLILIWGFGGNAGFGGWGRGAYAGPFMAQNEVTPWDNSRALSNIQCTLSKDTAVLEGQLETAFRQIINNDNQNTATILAGQKDLYIKQLEHFEHQLYAHDAMAAFVMGNCPTLCPEIKAVLAKWSASKKAA